MKRAKSENDDENVRKPFLSGAYIRSFVKQLASSRSSMREKTTSLEREEAHEDPPQPPQQQQSKKKQVRRRVQTRKPYQEKLLNMAEARREIVTALKLHRAAMKHHQQQTPEFQTEQKLRRNPRIYASNSDVNLSSWPALVALPPPPPPTFLDFALPSQALGLNLNLHDFITAPLSIYSSSSPSTSSSPPPPPRAAAADDGGGGERFEFLNCEGIRREEEREEEMVSSPFDEVMEFPAWLNANESCLQNVDDFCFQGSVLPCMDIGEIEGMDGDWLA